MLHTQIFEDTKTPPNTRVIEYNCAIHFGYYFQICSNLFFNFEQLSSPLCRAITLRRFRIHLQCPNRHLQKFVIQYLLTRMQTFFSTFMQVKVQRKPTHRNLHPLSQLKAHQRLLSSLNLVKHFQTSSANVIFMH